MPDKANESAPQSSGGSMKLYTDAEFEAYAEAAHKAGVVFSVTPDGVVSAEYNPAAAKCVASWDADGDIEQPMPDEANKPSITEMAGMLNSSADIFPPTAQGEGEESAVGDLQEILILNQELERALDALQALLRIVYCAPLSARSGDEDWPDRAAALLLKHRSKDVADVDAALRKDRPAAVSPLPSTAEEGEWERWNRERGMLFDCDIVGMLTEVGKRRLEILNRYCEARTAALATDSPFSDAWDVDALSATDSNAPSVDGLAGDVQPLRPRE